MDDGTGKVTVDAGPRWYHQIDLTSGERVTVVGEYDDDFDAYTIARDNGEVIQIRQADGPPPWAGSMGEKIKILNNSSQLNIDPTGADCRVYVDGV